MQCILNTFLLFNLALYPKNANSYQIVLWQNELTLKKEKISMIGYDSSTVQLMNPQL